MHGTTATRAYKMITQSDDAIASAFYGSVGGDSLINWIKTHYKVPDLGSPPHRKGWWGNTHITARGLVKFYAKVKSDKLVGPWLLNAMHHATKYGSDGTYQFFGLPSATTGAAVKQGWGNDYDDWGRSADFNTTGFVNGDRYAVAILARGPISTYGSKIGAMLTRTARLLLPGGHFPDAIPIVKSVSATSGSTAGGLRVTVRGTDFTHVSGVLFGGVLGRSLKVLSSTTLQVTSPAHTPVMVHLHVRTDHGTSDWRPAPFRYISPPAVTSVSPSTGATTGATSVQIRGTDFVKVTKVLFGTVAAPVQAGSTATLLRVSAPPQAAGRVDVRVLTAYGTSRVVAADGFTYGAAPAVTGLTPGVGPAAGGTTVTLQGTDLSSVTAVRFDGVAGTNLQVLSSQSVSVVAPSHAAGSVNVVAVSPYGASASGPASVFRYQ
jgi:hypothetical protein